MFNVGGGEIIVILLIALIVLGPDKLPDAARKAGKVMGDLRRLSDGFKQEMAQVADFSDDAAPGAPNGPYLVGPPAPADAPPDTAPTPDAPVTRGDATSPTPANPALGDPPTGPTGDVADPPTEQAGGSSAA